MLLEKYGYEILRCVDGAYHLGTCDGQQQFIALLHAEAPLTPQTESVKLMLFALELDVQADDVLDHWRNLDARQLSAADVAVADIPLPVECVRAVSHERLVFTRPSGFGARNAVRLTTGDIVCYN